MEYLVRVEGEEPERHISRRCGESRFNVLALRSVVGGNTQQRREL